MHLLLAQKGAISDADEAIDLGQSVGEVIFLSSADTELCSIAAAKSVLLDKAYSLRLANLMALSHPMSVDQYIERTAKFARLIVVRVIGGVSYWRYGLETLYAAACAHDIKLVVLPGDDKPDPTLMRFCSISREDCDALWQYLIEGGSFNAQNFLNYCGFILGINERPISAKPLMKAGLWWPNLANPSLTEIQNKWQENGVVANSPIVPITFYRALVQSGQTEPIAAIVEALQQRGLAPLPLFISSLKDSLSVAILDELLSQCPPALILNTTGFAVSSLSGETTGTVLDKYHNMVLQVVLSGSDKATWQSSSRGLPARDIAMNVSLPEVDGRVLTRAISFKAAEFFDEEVEANIIRHQIQQDRVDFVADLARNWIKLGKKAPIERNVALVMANYPGGDGRLGHGVGLDTPAATHLVLNALQNNGYNVENIPETPLALMEKLIEGPTNEGVKGRIINVSLALHRYRQLFAQLPQITQDEMKERWGDPQGDATIVDDAFALPILSFGKIVVALQPERAFGMDAKQVYHAPDIVPSHHYMAFYFWLRHVYGADAIVHMGKHGNLEWLPGKALALSQNCYPELALGAIPHIYPFIVNDPGEGTQAKRRSSAVIIDHMTPPLTRAESYGPLKDLEVLVDEYYEASGVDPRRLLKLKDQILQLVDITGIGSDAGIKGHDDENLALQKLDAFLCDLKELQIRDGLHVFGRAPTGKQLTDLLVALVRVPRGQNEDGSLHRAIANDLDLGFDPLNCDLAAPWQGKRPQILADLINDPWRSFGDSVERIELLAASLVEKTIICPALLPQTQIILQKIDRFLRPLVESCGNAEMNGLLTALDGKFVAPGPSGAPTRGRLDVLPTGRNFYSVDNRAVPTPAAWDLGFRSAELLIKRYVQDHGDWPKALGLTVWGTSNMRTGGDDIAQALALLGVKPLWDMASRRVTGYEIIPLEKLCRPRVDVTLRISGFFRDAFPDQLVLLDQAIRAVGALDEEEGYNPIAANMKGDMMRFMDDDGLTHQQASQKAGYRIFGAKPGHYGTGLQELLDSGEWDGRDDLGKAWLANSDHAYGIGEGETASAELNARMVALQLIVQNQDNREHDLLDSGEYYAFEGGMAAAAATQSGLWPQIYHNDLSRPERPLIKTLEEEIARTLRGRAINPKWIASAMRHGFKGGVEMAASVDYLFAFAATTNAVRSDHFEAIYDAYINDDMVRSFLTEQNPAALREIAQKLNEALDRGLWVGRSNSAAFQLEELQNKGE
ncbi:cobaltochelatase subunit CobN [Bartonella sp. HY406]|uniref:cobaltochelatase subunit CobN n=1 Tax=Bartonella sp. HY406 TaxID=2979331 RepID=UPI0021C9E0F4|nr:cobaltochelatase subunit CobN [Bartonella sp. HY406]UXN04641.1 cobaltochelatase subunit CobN [Bartonella sp. HY406]